MLSFQKIEIWEQIKKAPGLVPLATHGSGTGGGGGAGKVSPMTVRFFRYDSIPAAPDGVAKWFYGNEEVQGAAVSSDVLEYAHETVSNLLAPSTDRRTVTVS
jgi:hypothetical protein